MKKQALWSLCSFGIYSTEAGIGVIFKDRLLFILSNKYISVSEWTKFAFFQAAVETCAGKCENKAD